MFTLSVRIQSVEFRDVALSSTAQHNDHVDLSTREHESNLSSCSRVEDNATSHMTPRRTGKKKLTVWRSTLQTCCHFSFCLFLGENRGLERHALFHTTPVERHAHNTQHTRVFEAHFLVSTCSRWVSTFFFLEGGRVVSRPIINMLKPICWT